METVWGGGNSSNQDRAKAAGEMLSGEEHMLFFRGPESDYQHPCRGSQPSVIPRESDDSSLLKHLHPCVYPLTHIYIHIIEK